LHHAALPRERSNLRDRPARPVLRCQYAGLVATRAMECWPAAANRGKRRGHNASGPTAAAMRV